MDDLLQQRIANIYAAVGETIQQDLSYLKFEQTKEDTVAMDINGGLSQAQIENLARSAIHNLSMYFDCCCAWARSGGAPLDDVKAVTANSTPLRIIRDLDNNDKHPHTPRENSSGVSPKLGKVMRILRIPGSNPGMIFSFNAISITFPVNTHAVVTADIVNRETGAIVADLRTVLEHGVLAWETFLRSKGLLPQQRA